jgi:DNA repair photolyase
MSQEERQKFHAGAVPRPDYLQHLRKDARKYQAAGIHEQVLLCFTTDAYNPSNTSLTRPTIEILIEHGLGFCVLTKGGSRSLVDLDLYRSDRDAYACTLTSLDDAFSQKWESAAALPGDRIAALKTFHEAGIFTWVSLEPVLDVERSLAIVQQTHEYVDLYKVGRVNYQPATKATDWKKYAERMVELLNKLGAAHYIKHDLQPYLPEGYHNPMRVPQHHGGTK